MCRLFCLVSVVYSANLGLCKMCEVFFNDIGGLMILFCVPMKNRVESKSSGLILLDEYWILRDVLSVLPDWKWKDFEVEKIVTDAHKKVSVNNCADDLLDKYEADSFMRFLSTPFTVAAFPKLMSHFLGLLVGTLHLIGGCSRISVDLDTAIGQQQSKFRRLTLNFSHLFTKFAVEHIHYAWWYLGRSSLFKMEVGKENRNIKDHHRRLLAEKFELRRNLYKALVRDPTLPQEMRELHAYKLAKLPRNSSFTRVRNRCVFSGRPRGVYQLFRMSRIVFRTLANQGVLNGIRKASW
ncbi:unnamed protein product [Dovyalis caffra]|uniref:Small ribosomal subunit protein uS14m n=1 Tax=Dovyalis caffra TaxID=77055 RepID=A0AAV1RPY2_9ROSI|nr:unnamed protein product [Dovyalis caffra]